MDAHVEGSSLSLSLLALNDELGATKVLTSSRRVSITVV